ncbi:hypothetical protein HU200_023905 [Digitaria exilis]|uniref:HRDC domain-containing protein n=1 Tax=Digitaria exilis TaxID=1010633 RepID=A0A835EYA4_9POAL|nr:hypothetical protein HU200_023905 [Digitaria exilis]
MLLSRYAREDTHYLLYIYDLMKQRLQRESTPENDLLLEVKFLFLWFPSYMLQEHELNAKQLAALHEWRDRIARQEDESTGYVLPNKALIEIVSTISYTPFGTRLNILMPLEGIAEQLKKERLEQLALKSVQASDETALLDAVSDRSNTDPADPSSVAPSSVSVSNVNVASGSGAGLMNETALIDRIH